MTSTCAVTCNVNNKNRHVVRDTSYFRRMNISISAGLRVRSHPASIFYSGTGGEDMNNALHLHWRISKWPVFDDFRLSYLTPRYCLFLGRPSGQTVHGEFRQVEAYVATRSEHFGECTVSLHCPDARRFPRVFLEDFLKIRSRRDVKRHSRRRHASVVKPK